MKKDERSGCPSASAFSRYHRCKGSFTLCKAVPDEPPSPGATRGSNVHGALAGEIPITKLSIDEQHTVEELTVQEEMLLNEVFLPGNSYAYGEWKIEKRYVEKRMWHDASESRWSGKADKLFVLKQEKDGKVRTAGLVLDYKSTRYAEPAEENMQLMALATLFDYDQGCIFDEMFVGLVYPDGWDLAAYDMDTLQDVAEQLNQLVDQITISHTNVRTPSPEACRWCRAKSICPEARGEVKALAKTEALGVIPVADMPRLLNSCTTAESVIKEIRNQARIAIENGQQIDGWELKPGHVRRKITDTETVYQRAACLGVDGQMFSKQVTISKKDLEKLVRDELEYEGKQVADTVKELMEGCTTETKTAPSLRARKEKQT